MRRASGLAAMLVTLVGSLGLWLAATHERVAAGAGEVSSGTPLERSVNAPDASGRPGRETAPGSREDQLAEFDLAAEQTARRAEGREPGRWPGLNARHFEPLRPDTFTLAPWRVEGHEPGGALRMGEVGRDDVGLLAHVRGMDLAAPRQLALWRLDLASGEAALLARGHSRPNGRFRFERLLVSSREVTLVVTGELGSPYDAEASSKVSLPALRLPPPRVWAAESATGASSGDWLVQLIPGASLLVDAGYTAHTGHTRTLRRHATPHKRVIGLVVSSSDLSGSPDGVESLRFAQETPDGRRSRWAEVRRDTPALDWADLAEHFAVVQELELIEEEEVSP